MVSTESRIVDMAVRGRFPHPMSRRAFLSAAGAAGIVLGASACGASGSSGSGAAQGGGDIRREKTWCQVTTLTNDYFVAFNEGAKQAMGALGVAMVSLESQANVNTAINQVGNVRAQGGKSMFGTPATESEAAAVTKACQAAGILYASSYTAPPWYTPADADSWVRFITPPSTKIAEATARALFDEVGGSGTIIHVPGQKGSSADNQRTAGLRKALRDYPDIKLVTASPGDWTSEAARISFTNILPSVRDFAGVFAQNDSEAAGVIAALDSRGIKGKVVTGFDGNKQNLQYIADGKQYLTSVTIGGLTAALLGITLFDVLNGVELALPERFLSQGALLVTPDTAGKVLDTVYTGQLPFDWPKMSKALNPDAWDPQTLLNPLDPRELYAGVPQDEYQLNAAWDSADLGKVRTAYSAAFRSGPLFEYKDQLVA
ncbi:sugar ABC transporter substrate-binding protein [Prauserella muralis]|uniref:Periplasmic binding protein domain-containing protein n=1 Tax=Prauserella muralis TaxID=588067 RepID=A0A2V4B1N4_9PSEU|nr:sugar ABC transporter substrate-binding protein [Prauserella muralis]PXY27902.1 hypothetical protein BAY60_16230 [Prauserella muralis]TWE22318.1 ribose transport system substrate-binding protein [Prauserella muralis]